MSTTRRWGPWSLKGRGAYLSHDGGYNIELREIQRSGAWWWDRHLSGKGWATPQVRRRFLDATLELLGDDGAHRDDSPPYLP